MTRVGLRVACLCASVLACGVDERDAGSDLVDPISHWLPGPHASSRTHEPERDAARAALEQSCRGCHTETAAQWQDSQHAGSWTDAAIVDAFAGEPLPFCQGCHAPEVPATQPVPEWAAELGIGCVTCHVEPDTERVWAAGPRLELEAESEAPHALARSPAFARATACAGCHEFAFPDSRLRAHPLAMQATVSEHARSALSDRSCSDCHMPTTAEGRRDHRFLGAHDPAMLRRSLAIDVTRTPDRVRISLQPAEVGHDVPTGDHLRQLEVSLAIIEADGRERVVARRWLRREFEQARRANGLSLREQLSDTRVGVQGQQFEFELSADTRAHALRWRVLHQRVAEARSGVVLIEGELELANGLLPILEP
jgi:hypothetical protein